MLSTTELKRPSMDFYILGQGSFINHVDSRGGGVGQMTILKHKSNLVKVTTKGRGVKIPKILTTWFMENP